MIRGTEAHRLFVDVTRGGCPCECAYCFVERGPEVPLDEETLARLPALLERHPRFSPGATGPLLAFGSRCDLFRNRRLAELAIRAIADIAPYGNAIQISTKHYVRPEWAGALAQASARYRQITIFVSCATIRQHRLYEPHTPPPAWRFRSFASLRDASIPACLHLMPFIAGVSNKESEEFARVLGESRSEAFCIGGLFLNEALRAQLRPEQPIERLDRTKVHPLMTDTLGMLHPMSEFTDGVRDRVDGILIFESSVCAVAHIQRRSCWIHGDVGCPPFGVSTRGVEAAWRGRISADGPTPVGVAPTSSALHKREHAHPTSTPAREPQ
jgi:DNA repair photolyase